MDDLNFNSNSNTQSVEPNLLHHAMGEQPQDNLPTRSEHSTKSTRITIRIANQDLSGIKKKAQEGGLPYQTLISSILHQYASGKIKLEL